MVRFFRMKYTFIYLVFILLLDIFFPTIIIANSKLGKEIDIIPSPKVIEVGEKKLLLSHEGESKAIIIIDNDDPKAAIAAEAINERVRVLGGKTLPIEKNYSKVGRQIPINNLILLSCGQQNKFIETPREALESGKELQSKGEQSYFIKFFQNTEGGGVALLTGNGWLGLLHASSTFLFLIRKEESTIYASEAQITDWPDFKFRGVPVWPLPSSYDEFKKYVDWAFQYKFNRVYTYSTRTKAADGFNLPTPEERLYLKKINNYAKERGIIINYSLNWAVGTATIEEEKEAFQETLLFNGHYYTWSDDFLLRKRAIEIARFAREIDAGSIHLHCMDTYEENWGQRRPKDYRRFGNDRASADANVINIFTEEIRRINPGIELQFIVYPYHINFSLKGNEQYKIWMRALTRLVSEDVYFIVAEFNRDQADSWIEMVRQPLVHWINGNAYLGRDSDIIIHFEPIGYFNGEVIQLVASEYEWNVDAAGNKIIEEDKAGEIKITGSNLHYRQEMIDGKEINSYAWYDGTKMPEQTASRFLLKACRIEFGEEAAPYLVDFFRNNPVGWRSATLYNQVLRDVMAGQELDASRDQLNKTKNALTSLKKALNVKMIDSLMKEKLRRLLKYTYRQCLVISATTTYYQAKQLSTKDLNAEALEVIENGYNQLVEIQKEMEKMGCWSSESREWYEEGERRVKDAETGIRKSLSTNLLRNPGFEDTPAPSGLDNSTIPRWSSSGHLELSDNAHKGKWAAILKLKPSDEFVSIEQPFNVPAEKTCYVEFWLKKDGDFRVIPMFQYRDAEGKKESLAINDFPFVTIVPNYLNFSGFFRFPHHVKDASFRLYADWFGFIPNKEKSLYVDDIFVSCDHKK
jgi:hypothetical protein